MRSLLLSLALLLAAAWSASAQDAKALFDRAWDLMQEGKFAVAEELCAEGLRLDPDNQRALLIHAQLAEWQGASHEEIRTRYAAVMEVDPSSPEGLDARVRLTELEIAWKTTATRRHYARTALETRIGKCYEHVMPDWNFGPQRGSVESCFCFRELGLDDAGIAWLDISSNDRFTSPGLAAHVRGTVRVDSASLRQFEATPHGQPLLLDVGPGFSSVIGHDPDSFQRQGAGSGFVSRGDFPYMMHFLKGIRTLELDPESLDLTPLGYEQDRRARISPVDRCSVPGEIRE